MVKITLVSHKGQKNSCSQLMFFETKYCQNWESHKKQIYHASKTQGFLSPGTRYT